MTASSDPSVIMPSIVWEKLAARASNPKSDGTSRRPNTSVLIKPSTRMPRRQAMTHPAPRTVRARTLRVVDIDSSGWGTTIARVPWQDGSFNGLGESPELFRDCRAVFVRVELNEIPPAVRAARRGDTATVLDA